MSGMFGIWYKDGHPVTPQILSLLQKPLLPYGPDGRQIWYYANVGLGHVRLHTTPESQQEQLPLATVDVPRLRHVGPYVITADARIDNREELFDLLDIDHADRAEMPDGTLILHAYKEWGGECAKYLTGAYAFAVWNQQTQTFFCVRDHVGGRPFYYYNSPKLFLFATELQSLLALTEVPQQLDENAIAATRALGTRELLTRTLFHDVMKLPPAHCLSIHTHGQQLERYWQLGQVPTIRLKGVEAYIDLLQAEVKRAVVACTRSAFPIGSHLSGGLDSSSVTVLAAQQLRSHGKVLAGVFSWSPPPTPTDRSRHDEYALIEAVCEQERLTCYYTTLSTADVISNYQRDISREPPMYLLCEPAVRRAAVAQGIRIMLSGWGGDEIVTYNGDGYLAQLLHQGRWLKLGEELQAYRKIYGGSLRSHLRAQVFQPHLPDWLLRYWSRNIERPGPAYHAEEVSDRLWHNQQQVRTRATPDRTRRHRWDNGHITARLEAWAAQTDGHSIDYRYPLLDRRLLDICFAIPPQYFFHDGWRRYLYRQAMQGVLPASVCWNRSKRDPAREKMVQQIVPAAWAEYSRAVQSGHLCLKGVPQMALRKTM